jgi:hypothetical protein
MIRSRQRAHSELFAFVRKGGITAMFAPLIPKGPATKPRSSEPRTPAWTARETGAEPKHHSPTAKPRVQPLVYEASRSSGQPLDGRTRDSMESLLGHDFSKVRIHADQQSAAAAHSLHAAAYTVGNDIVFGGNRFALECPEGRSLLIHELRHIGQQRWAAKVEEPELDSPTSHMSVRPYRRQAMMSLRWQSSASNARRHVMFLAARRIQKKNTRMNGSRRIRGRRNGWLNTTVCQNA